MSSDKAPLLSSVLGWGDSLENDETNPLVRTYFYSQGQLYYYDSDNTVYRNDGTVVHVSNSPALGLNLFEPDFHIEGIPYYFGIERNLVSPGKNGSLQLVNTWKGSADELPPDQHAFSYNFPAGTTMKDTDSHIAAETTMKDTDSHNDVEITSFNPFPGLFSFGPTPLYPTSTDSEQGSGLENILAKWRGETKEAQRPVIHPTRDRRRRCPICNKMFRRPSSLEDHLNVHSGDKPHICPFPSCKIGFATISNRRRHFFTHRLGQLEHYRPANSHAEETGESSRDGELQQSILTQKSKGLLSKPSPIAGRLLPRFRIGADGLSAPKQSHSSAGSDRVHLSNNTPPTCRSSFMLDTSLFLPSYYGAGSSSDPFKGPQLAFESSNPTKIRIGHNTSLAQMCKYLVDNGCPDVSEKITHVDGSPTFSGELSDVFRGKLTNGTIVAVKCLRPPTNRNKEPDKTLKRTAHELFVWSLMAHPNVLDLLGFATSHNILALVIPWIKYGSLISYLDENSQADRCGLCSQVAEGLVYVHNLGITHGDLRGDNISVSEDGTAKITNFGSATMRQEFSIIFTATRNLHYSIRWAAPELFSGISGLEADVYALGMTILETLTGNVPYKNHGDLTIIHTVMVRKELPGRPTQKLPPHSKQGNALWGLLQHCWSSEPTLRPTAAEVRDFLQGIYPGDLEEPRSDALALPMEIKNSKLHSSSTIPVQSSDELGSSKVNLPTPNFQGDVLEVTGRPTNLDIDVKIENTRHPELIIKRDTDLPTIIEYLVHNGCVDVTSQLTNVSEYSRFSGKQSDVYRAQLCDGTTVAVKCLRELSNSGHGPNKVLKHTAHELYTWSISSHPNILGLVGLAIVRDKLAMVAPWMEYGSLLAYINANPKTDRCDLCRQIAEGLTYMHTLGVAHGDMKGDNVVVSKEGIAKITDFGCATMKREFPVTFTATESLQYSVRWAAPELFLEDGATTFETDVYAFGMTILEVLSGDVPYKERGDFAVIHTVLVKKELPNRPHTCISPKSVKGDEMWHLMERCWDIEPKSRPKMGEVRDFLRGITPSDIIDS